MSTPGQLVRRVANEAGAAVIDASNAMRAAVDRINELETALNRLVLMVENTQSDSEGRWPQPDCGCIFCTAGTVPNRLNTGPCALHNAKDLLGQL